jgi:hypothetical protein
VRRARADAPRHLRMVAGPGARRRAREPRVAAALQHRLARRGRAVLRGRRDAERVHPRGRPRGREVRPDAGDDRERLAREPTAATLASATPSAPGRSRTSPP